MSHRTMDGAPELRFVNCAECETEIIGADCLAALVAYWKHEWVTVRTKYPPAVRGRISGRPYCDKCLSPKDVPAGLPATFDPEGAGAYQEIAIRHMEDNPEG